MSSPRHHLFDVRWLISGLLFVYGVILTIMGAGASASSLHKADGIRINLWVGIALLVVAIAFGLWARLRPLAVGESQENANATPSSRSAGTQTPNQE